MNVTLEVGKIMSQEIADDGSFNDEGGEAPGSGRNSLQGSPGRRSGGSADSRREDLSLDDASKELENLLNSAPISPRDLAKPLWNRNSSTPVFPYQDAFGNISDNSDVIAGQYPFGRTMNYLDSTQESIYNGTPPPPPPGRSPPANNPNATYVMDNSLPAQFIQIDEGSPRSPLVNNGRGLDDTFLETPMNPGAGGARQSLKPLPPAPDADDFTTAVNNYTNEILSDFKEQMAEALPAAIEAKAEEIVDQMINLEKLDAALDVFLPTMLSLALERLGMNAADSQVRNAFQDVIVDKVLPLMSKGVVRCNKPCECDCWQDYPGEKEGEAKCSEFGLPPLIRKFLPIKNKMPGDPRQLEIPPPPPFPPVQQPFNRTSPRAGQSPRRSNPPRNGDEDDRRGEEVCPCMMRR